MTDADLVILGGGSGGYACAFRAAELGLSVVLVEKDKLGGTCLHRGCIPTKALLHAAEVADSARDGGNIGVKSSLEGIDIAGVNSYKDGVIAKMFKGLTGLAAANKVNVVAGTGTFVAPNTVVVDGERYVGKNVVLATGSYPFVPPVPGRDLTGCFTYRTVDDLAALAGYAAGKGTGIVVGGGLLGLEAANALHRLGVATHVVEFAPRLMPAQVDDAGGAMLRRHIEDLGLTVHTGRAASRITGTGAVSQVVFEDGGVLHADVCSACHPFYTGKQKILDTGGRVARFEQRYAKKK